MMGVLHHQGLGNHQLTHQVDQLIEFAGVEFHKADQILSLG